MPSIYLFAFLLLFGFSALFDGVSGQLSFPLHRKERPRLTKGIPNDSDEDKLEGRTLSTLLMGGSVDFGEYFTEVYIGVPPQKFYVQVDTGSSDLLIFTDGCASCPSGATLYNPSASSQYSQVSCGTVQCLSCSQCCTFEDDYVDKSFVRGCIVNDYFSIANSSTVVATFGTVSSASANFEPNPVDGIWGIAGPATSSWKGESPITTVIDNENLVNVFSLCLIASDPAMTVGVSYAHDSRFSWTDLQNTAPFLVDITDIKVGGTSIGLLSEIYSDNVVDSGTTLLVLPTVVWEAMQSTMEEMCSRTSLVGVCSAGQKTLWTGYCFTMTPGQIAEFPEITFVIPGVTQSLNIPPSSYLIPQGKYFCLGFEENADDDTLIMGDVFMENFHVVFNIDALQLGFAPLSSCPKTAGSLTGQVAPSQSTTLTSLVGASLALSLSLLLLFL